MNLTGGRRRIQETPPEGSSSSTTRTTSINDAFVEQGFIYDGPTRIRNGVKRWSLVIHHEGICAGDLFDQIRGEMVAEIDVERLSMTDCPSADDDCPLDRRL